MIKYWNITYYSACYSLGAEKRSASITEANSSTVRDQETASELSENGDNSGKDQEELEGGNSMSEEVWWSGELLV